MGNWRKTGLRIVFSACLALCLRSVPALAETPAKAPVPGEHLYQLLVSLDRRCEAKIHVENLHTGWKRDYFLNAVQLDTAVDWSRGVGQATGKTVVLIDYGRDFGAFFRGASRSGVYAYLISRFTRGRLVNPGKWATRRFIWVSMAVGAAADIAGVRIFGDPDDKDAEERVREAFRKFEFLEEDVPTAFLAIRSRMPEKTEDVRDGACEEFAFPAKIAGKDYTNMLSLGINLGIDRAPKSK